MAAKPRARRNGDTFLFRREYVRCDFGIRAEKLDERRMACVGDIGHMVNVEGLQDVVDRPGVCAARIDDRFNLLTTGRRTAGPV